MDRQESPPIGNWTASEDKSERASCLEINPTGFHLRSPPAPHLLQTFITPDSQLFETIHMGAAVVDEQRWVLKFDGLIQQPFNLSLEVLKGLPSSTLTCFHECYGSPLKPPTSALWRIGNVKWTGVRLRTLLEFVRPLQEARYVWSDGLDYGSFGGKTMDRYQKDLPIEKAMNDEVLLAYEVNGKPLRKERGGPVRLVVPGWFGTNMTKWICRISLQAERSPSPYTTIWYNERDTSNDAEAMRPVWEVAPNSMIVEPAPAARVTGPDVDVRGWAWSAGGIAEVGVTADDGLTWTDANVQPRFEFSWQQFEAKMQLSKGPQVLKARATSVLGVSQPLKGRRNHVHKVEIEVIQ